MGLAASQPANRKPADSPRRKPGNVAAKLVQVALLEAVPVAGQLSPRPLAQPTAQQAGKGLSPDARKSSLDAAVAEWVVLDRGLANLAQPKKKSVSRQSKVQSSATPPPPRELTEDEALLAFASIGSR